MTLLYATIFNILLIAASVGFHFEILNWMSKSVPKLMIKNRPRVVVALLGAIMAHIVEIWMFAIAYYFLINTEEMGSLKGNFDGSLNDCFYFSVSTYTTVGYGDIEPYGHVRFLAGLEALTGLVLITWTASFLFVEMQKFWGKRN